MWCICHATGMEEDPEVTLDIHCLWRGGGVALTPGRGNLSDTIELRPQGIRDHPCPRDRAASRVQSSYARASRGPTSGSYSLPRDPGRVVWKARLDASR